MSGDGGPGALAAGVVRVAGPAGRVEERLQRAGWHAGLVSHGGTKQAFLESAGAALGFPGYYGRNLDALWDCLGDLERPTALVWDGWQELAVGSPDDWAGVMSVLAERASGPGVPFAVYLVDAAVAG